MDFDELMRRTGQPGDWREALAEIQAEHGRNASRWMSETFGVTRRTAQRWMSGQHEPGGRRGAKAAEAKAKLVGSVDERKAAARHLRKADTLVVGDVRLEASSFSGRRSVGEIPVTPEMRARLDQVADALEKGDPRAASMFGDAVIAAYFNKGNVGGRHSQSSMGISDYGSGAYIRGE